MTLDDTLEMLNLLVAGFPNQTVSGKSLVLYAERLKVFSPHQIRIAIRLSVENDTKFPSLKMLIDRAGTAPRDLGRLEELPVYVDTTCTPGVKHTFRNYKDSILAGQEYDEAELIGPRGVRGFPNGVFYRAREARLEKIRERFPFHNPPTDRDSFGSKVRKELPA